MTTEQMLEARHTLLLQWTEPWPGCGPEGNDIDAHVTMTATVHDCVALQRFAARARGRQTRGHDADHLESFMAVHWARPIELTVKEIT